MSYKINYVNIPQGREEDLRQFIRGAMLGDGSIPKIQETGKHYRLTLGHGEKQLEYLKWKQKYLRDFGLAGDSFVVRVDNNPRYKKPCITFAFKSFTHPIFTEYRNMYYPQGKKVVCHSDIENMNELTLAIWYMDDGHVWHRSKRTTCIVLNTTSFSEEDVKFLMELLYRKWKINSSLSYDNVIRITVESSPKFLELVEPYLLKLFDYKRVLLKPGELREQPEVVNPEPSADLKDQ